MNATVTPQALWSQEIASAPPPAADWLWHGFLAQGSLTLLTGMWKAGKTTLLSHLLSRRKQGGTLAGLDVKPGKTVVVTEENTTTWAERVRRGDYGSSACFISRPFLTIPKPAEWQALIDQILQLQTQHGLDLMVLDPLAPLLPSEIQPRAILETLLPLTALTARGMAVLAMHHPSKGHPALGQAARGSGALIAHVDISIEMRHPGGDPLTRRRRLLALSRFTETPRQLLIELNEDARDYTLVHDDGKDGFQANWDALRMIFEDAPQKLTCQDILGEWPADFDKPSRTNLRNWLLRALERGLIVREGNGHKSDPFRYWTSEREAVWKADPLYDIKHALAEMYPFVSLTEKKRNGRLVERLDEE